MHEIRVSVASPEAADYGAAELSSAGEPIGFTILEDDDQMVHIEPRRDHTLVVVGAQPRSGAQSTQAPTRAVLTRCWRQRP